MTLAVAPTGEFLDFQADRIERVLAARRAPVRVHGSAVLPGWIRFLLTPALGARLGTVRNLSEELAMALGAEEVRVARDGEALALEVPRSDAEPVRLLSLLKNVAPLPPLTACLGLADDGRPLLLRLPSPDVANVLVAGAAGSGKTELIRSMVVSLALANRQSRLQVALIDPKTHGFAPLAALPHLLGGVASDGTSALALLKRLVAELERRDREKVSTPHIVVAVDELVELLAVDSLAGPAAITRGLSVEQALTRIGQRGREVGLHLIVGVQKPTAPAVGPMLKANFPVRIMGRLSSAEEARAATGLGGTGAENLLGRGDFVAVAAGQAIRFQAAWVSTHDWTQITSDL